MFLQNPLSALSHRIPPLPLPPPPSPPPPLFSPLLPSHRPTTATSSSLSCRNPVVHTQRYVSGTESKALLDTVAVVEEEEEDGYSSDCSEFIEVGYVCNVHGLKGDLKVKPTTDFPELRFCKPGKRWLRARVMGKEVIREVELSDGRNHPGQKIWIISIGGIDTVDKVFITACRCFLFQAKQIVGSTILVKEDDRPILEDDEFYTPDLVGMRIVLKDGGTPVGTVVNVVNYGSSDLLQVMLDSAEENPNKSASSKIEVHSSGSLVWVPFVEAIVPDVDMIKRVMHITPPKGLLELNLRSDSMSKKERSQLEWKKKKKLQKRVIAAKKKLIEIGQKHVLDGFCFGEKDQKSMLANQIVNIKFNLFQHAVKSINIPSDRINLLECLNTETIQKNSLRVSRNYLPTTLRVDMEEAHSALQNGLDMLRECKIGIVLVVGGDNSSSSGAQVDNAFTKKQINGLLLHEFLCNDDGFMKIDGQRISTPLVIVSPVNEVQLYQELFSDHDYFGFDTQKVWFLEEEKLPILNSSLDDQSINRILLRSPWEIIQSPMGFGGVFSLLSSQSLLDDFCKWGIEYVQICTFTERAVVGHSTFLGLTSLKGMDVGIKVFDKSHGEDDFDVIFSMKYLTKIVKQVDKLQFDAIPVQNEHAVLVGKEWINIRPSAPNSICFRSSIYNLLDVSHGDSTCVLHITD